MMSQSNRDRISKAAEITEKKNNPNLLYEYLLTRYFQVVKSQQRTRLISILLIVVYYYWFICLIVLKDQQPINEPLKFQFIDTIHSISLFGYTDIGYSLLMVCLILNSTILALFLVDIFLFWLVKKGQEHKYCLTLQLITQFLINNLANVYEYLIVVPSLTFSLQCYGQPAAIPNIIFTLIIGTSFSLTDFSFSLNQDSDLLSRLPLSYLSVGKMISYIVIISNYTIFHYRFHQIILLIYTVISGGIINYYNIYAGHVRLLEVNFDCFLVILEFILVLSEYTHIDETALFVILISLTVLSVRISFTLLEIFKRGAFGLKKLLENGTYQLNTVPAVYSLNYSLKKISNLIFETYGQYCSNVHSPLIESMVLNHHATCPFKDTCYCNFNIEDDLWNNLIDQKKTKLFVFEFIKRLFRELENNHIPRYARVKAQFLYCHFLLEICKTSAIAYKELLFLSQMNDISLLDNMYTHYLLGQFKQSLQQTFTKCHQSLITENIFGAEKIEDTISVSYLSCLTLKKHLISLLNNNSINLIEVNHGCLQLLKERELLRESLRKCNTFALGTPMIQEILIGFQLFDSMNPFFLSLQNKSNFDQLHKLSGDFNQFANDCFILVDSSKGRLGQIKKVTPQFEQIFGYSSDVVGLSLSQIMPPSLIESHKESLKYFFQNIDERIQSRNHIPFVLAVDSIGFAIPLQVSYYLQSNFSENKSGIICKTKLIKSKNSYIMTELYSSKIEIMSYSLFQAFFCSADITQNSVNQILLCNIVPIFSLIVQKYESQNIEFFSFSSLAFFPMKSKSNSQLFEDSYSLQDIILGKDQGSLSADCFQIDFKVYISQKKSVRFCILELDSLKRIPDQDVPIEIKKLSAEIAQLEKEINRSDKEFFRQQRELKYKLQKRSTKQLSLQSPVEWKRALLRESTGEILSIQRDFSQQTQAKEEKYTTQNELQTQNPILNTVSLKTQPATTFRSIVTTSQQLLGDNPSQGNPVSSRGIQEESLGKHISKDKNSHSPIKNELVKQPQLQQLQFESKISSQQDQREFVKQIKPKEQILPKAPTKPANMKKKEGIESKQRRAKKGKRSEIEQSQVESRSMFNRINRQILSQKKMPLIQIAAVFVLASMLTIILISVIYFYKSKELFEKQKMSLEYISWPMSLRSIYSTELYYVQYLKMIDSQLFPETSAAEQSVFRAQTVERIKAIAVDEFSQLYIELANSDKSKYPYFENNTISYEFEYAELRDDKSYYNVTRTLHISYYYFLQLYQSAMKRYVTLIRNVMNEEAFNNLNFLNFDGVMGYLLSDIILSAESNLDDISANFTDIIYIIAGVSISIIAVSLTLFVTLRKSIRSTMNIFVTFQPLVLKNMFISCEILENQFSSAYIKESNVDRVIMVLSKLKKTHQITNTVKSRGISTAAVKMPLVSTKMLGISFLTLALLIMQPIATLILVNSQIEESRINISLMKNIYDMKGHIASNMFLNLALVYQRLVTDNGFYQQAYFSDSLPYFIALNKKKLQNIDDVISQELQKSRYRQSLYDGFFHKILNGNICIAINDYPQFSTNFDFEIAECVQIRDAILTKGFALACSYLFEYITPIYQILANDNDPASVIAFKAWEVSQFHIYDFDRFVDYLLNAVTVMKKFIVYISNDYINSMQETQIWLLIVYCLSILVILLAGWIHLGQYYDRITHQTNQFFSFFDQPVLLSNPYVSKHFNLN